MRLSPVLRSTALLAALLPAPRPSAADAARDPIAAVVPNDNRRAAGRLEHGVLTVALEARTGLWIPEGATGPHLTVAAFAVVGDSLQTPGPLLRVPVGTEVRATVHNALAAPMWIYGLGATRGYHGDSALVAPGETHAFHFRATTPGLGYYAGRTSADPVAARLSDDAQLNGAIVVDPVGRVPDDRVFVISGWVTIDPHTLSGLGPNAVLTFNGLGWPFTPRIDMAEGDSARWRFINATPLPHPLHLHGTYFRIDARGDGVRDTLYDPAQRRMAVTELLEPGQTMSMAWKPEHSGNWIFHCHIASHMAPRALFETDRRMPSHPDTTHTPEHMAGLVIGIRVAARGPAPAAPPVSEQLRLIARSRANVYGEHVGYGFVRGGSAEEAQRDSFHAPGPTLELVRGRRVAITIVNQMHESLAVHWHGIELESFPDGVPGWSGAGSTTMPHVMPGDSITVRFTPPRAGTFMYHSHANEMQQISSGLYGAIIVREPGTTADSRSDRLLMLSDDGPTLSLIGRSPPILMNGREHPDTMQIRAGRPTLVRLINIRTESTTDLRLEQDGHSVPWRIVAKDGMPLPAMQRQLRPAALRTAPGEIYDIELAPRHAGVMALTYASDVSDTGTVRTAYIRAH